MLLLHKHPLLTANGIEHFKKKRYDGSRNDFRECIGGSEFLYIMIINV